MFIKGDLKTIIRNNCIDFEQFKIVSGMYFYWIANVGSRNDDTWQNPYFWIAYDVDDSARPSDSNLILRRQNCRFKTLRPGKVYRQTIRPRWAQEVPDKTQSFGTHDDIQTFRSARHDNPWFDTNSIVSDKKLGFFPGSSNCYKYWLSNPNPHDAVTVMGYWSLVIMWRGHARVQ